MEFKALSPIHISNGNTIGFGTDYVISEKGFLCKYNSGRIAKSAAKDNLFPFGKSSAPSDIITKILELLKSCDDSIYDYKVDSQKSFAALVRNACANKRFGEVEVKEFANANGVFYVPGSSVKGTLLTALGRDHLGINPEKDESNFKEERFVINDSDSISPENFCVFQTNIRDKKPRVIRANFICIKPNAKFELSIQKNGKLALKDLLSGLKSYSSKQISELKKYLVAIMEREDEAVRAFSDSLDYILDKSSSLKPDESLINIGLGGGNWFKVSGGKPGKSPAQTGFTFMIDGVLSHMGWCKVKIEETE